MAEEVYYPKSCKSIPAGTEAKFKKGFTNYEADAIKMGLKDELNNAFESYQDTHLECYGVNCISNFNFKAELSSFSYDLNDDGIEEVFTVFDTPGFCGSAGCPVYLIQKINGKWTIGLEDKAMDIYKSYFVFSSSRIFIDKEKINGYKVIYARTRDYRVDKPEKCPYDIRKYIYDEKIQKYKTQEYK